MHATRSQSWWFIVLGASTIAMGALAALSGFQSSLEFEVSVGLIFLIAGLAHALHSFWYRAWGGFYYQLLGATHYLIIGLMLLANRGPGVEMLILLLSLLLIMQGMVQYGLASQICLTVTKHWTLVSGTIAIVLGILTWMQWPNTTYWVIGLFVGVHLLFSGLSVLVLALVMRQLGGQSVWLPSKPNILHQRV